MSISLTSPTLSLSTLLISCNKQMRRIETEREALQEVVDERDFTLW